MKTRNLMKLQTLLLTLFVSSALIMGSCKKDKDNTKDGNKTALNALIVSSDSLLAVSTTADFNQADIDAFDAYVASVKTAATPTLTQTEIDNLKTQLTEAKKAFSAKKFGFIDESLYLVAGWHFDEGVGTTATSFSTGRQVGTFSKGFVTLLGADAQLPTWVNGVKGGKAISLDKGAHLTVPYSPSFLPASITISAWIKNNVQGWENNCIVSLNYWHGYKFATQSVGKPLFTEWKVGGGAADFDNEGGGVVTPLVWTHVAVALNSTTKTLAFYINGLNVKTFTETNGVAALTQSLSYVDGDYTYTPQPFLIGTFANDAELAAKPLNFNWISAANLSSFSGAIDELRVYNTALTDGQVSRIYKDEKP